MIYKRKPNAIYIELNPRTDKDYWTGEVELNIVADPSSSLDEESRSSLLHLAQLVCTSIPLMDLDPNVARKMENLLKSHIKSYFKPIEDDNVIKIDFKTKKKQ